MDFPKYRKFGDYHWRQYSSGSKYRTHADFVKTWIKEKNILDIGAGDGKITHLLGAKGIDDEATGVALAREHGADVILGDAYHMPFADGEFDSAFMGDVLEHFESPVEALQEAKRVINDCLYVSTPPKRPDGRLTDRYHYKEYTPEELKEFVEAQGFVLEGEIISNPEKKIMYAKFRKVTNK